MIEGNAGRGQKLLAIFLFFAAASAFAGLLFGSVHIPADTVSRALLSSSDGKDNVAHQIVWQLRLPRILAAFACGGLLALAGVLLQVLLRNPLADPYILGVSGGAAVGALLAMLLGWGLVLTNFASLAGALAAIAIVFGLSFRAGGWNLYRGALQVSAPAAGGADDFDPYPRASERRERHAVLADGGRVRAEEVLPAWVTLCVVTAVSMLFSRSLNVLGLGQLKAQTLGVAVLPLQVGIYFCASVATVAALMLAGAIGFVGLIVPHAVRLLGVSDFRWLLPLSILLGGSFLTLADTLARTLWAPQQLPVGVLTALLGVPMLLLLLSRKP